MNANPRISPWLLLGTALSLSVGWGIRGNFGHEYGAMIPGALASMAAALLAGRRDWWPRTAYFGFFGALGWSLGGSMSYMQVIAYTHSGHSASVLYGFACLFLIGFLWAALGGAGAALPACLNRQQLAAFLPPLTAIFVAWCLQDIAVGLIEHQDSQFRHASPLYWYDTDWLAALTALLAVGLLALARRRLDPASSLLLHMALGWWAGFSILVLALGWRMTPPRGDNWSGCVGMVLGLWVFLHRQGWRSVGVASLITGLFGGFAFATATLLKLMGMTSGLQTNWHSILEQTYGFLNGIGLAVSVFLLARHAEPVDEPKPASRAADIYVIAFVLLVITYVNLAKNPAVWIQAKAVPSVLYGLSAMAWFNLAYLALSIMLVTLLMVHERRRLALIPDSPLGQGQLLYLVFLWWVVIGNFERAVVGFAPQRLVTEGVIHLNAALCTFLLLAMPRLRAAPEPSDFPRTERSWSKQLVATGLMCAILSITLDWILVRAVYGDRFAGQAALHIRFGPNATATKAKPKPDQPHP